MSKSVSARLKDGTFVRLKRLASADDRSLSQVVVKAVQYGLPELEKEILGEEFAGRDVDGQQAEVPA